MYRCDGEPARARPDLGQWFPRRFEFADALQQADKGCDGLHHDQRGAEDRCGGRPVVAAKTVPQFMQVANYIIQKMYTSEAKQEAIAAGDLTRRGINGLMVHLDEKDDEIEQLKRDLDAALERLRDTERELENAQKGFEMVEQQIHTLGEDVDEDDRQVFEIIKRKAKARRPRTEAMVKVLRTRSGGSSQTAKNRVTTHPIHTKN